MNKKIKLLKERFAYVCVVFALTNPELRSAWEHNFGYREGIRFALVTMGVPDYEISEIQEKAEFIVTHPV
jgi:hypothetical protein